MSTPSSSQNFNTNKFRSFVILDLETSGIPENNYGRVSILEICMYGFKICELQKKCMELAVHKEKEGEEEAEEKKIDEIFYPTMHNKHKKDNCAVPPTPRTLIKLSLCVHPRICIKQEVTNLTGLDNYMLEDFDTFNENTGSMVINFIKHLPQPVCLVAHNGKFDFPILKATLTKINVQLPDDVMCCDSLRAFIEIDKENLSQRETKTNGSLENAELEKTYEKEGEARRELNETTPKRSIAVQGSKMYSKRARTENEDYTPQKCPRPETPTTSSINKEASTSRRALFQDDQNITPITEQMALARLIEKFYPPKFFYRLGNIYKRVLGPITNTLHRAETDVELLMRLVLHYGEDFLNYAQSWAVPYSAIPDSVRSTN